jgi:hypothetical protein
VGTILILIIAMTVALAAAVAALAGRSRKTGELISVTVLEFSKLTPLRWRRCEGSGGCII